MLAIRYPQVKIQGYVGAIENFGGGTNTLINEKRLNSKFAVSSVNLMQVEDGIWASRWGRDYYGQPIPNVSSIDGACEFVRADGTRELVAVAGGKFWKSVDGGSWSEVTGYTFTEGKRVSFLQIEDRLYIANGYDDLTYYNGTSLYRYSAISAPSAPSGTRGSGLTTGSYPNYYRVVATNGIGYTTPSPSLSIPTNKPRSVWNGTTEKITLTITPVSGATGYEIYYGEYDGEEVFLAKTTTTTFEDDGSILPNPFIETPNDNTTSAPKFTSMEVSGNRLWATGDTNNPFRVYGSGVGQYFGYFSPFYGGFYIDVEKGGRNKPIAVTHYRDGKGNPMITVLCSSPDGYGSIFQIELTATTIGDTTFIVPSAYKIVGSIGADASGAVVKAGDNVFFLNKKGVYVLRNKQQMFNVLSTDDLSAPIRNNIASMDGGYISKAVGYYKPPMVFFSIPLGSENNRIIIFDMERNNWNYAWTFGVKQFLEYTTNSGATKFLAVPNSGNRLVEISPSYTTDFGEPFYQEYISPILPVSANYADMARVREVIFELGNFRGSLSLEVLGITKNKSVSSIGVVSVSSTTGTSGVGDELVSDAPLVGDASDNPKLFAEPTNKKLVRVRKRVYAIQFKVWTLTGGTFFKLLGVQARGILIPARAPSSWRS